LYLTSRSPTGTGSLANNAQVSTKTPHAGYQTLYAVQSFSCKRHGSAIIKANHTQHQISRAFQAFSI